METYTDGYGAHWFSFYLLLLENRAKTAISERTQAPTRANKFEFSQFCSYKSLMRLNITRVRPEDFGEYQCVSKNEINTTAATFFIYGNDKYIHKHTNDAVLPCTLHCYSSNPKNQRRCLHTISIDLLHFVSFSPIYMLLFYSTSCRRSTPSNAFIFWNSSVWNATTENSIVHRILPSAELPAAKLQRISMQQCFC